MASPCSGDPSTAGLPPCPVAPPGETHGPAAPQELPFPDIYGGDAQLWEAHFRGIGRAYRALGKEDDFAIRVLTEDFTLPFPFAWPPGPDPARGPLFYDPHDRTGFDFLLRGPGAPPPALLRPLHNTAQAAVRKRRLEQLALSYAHRAPAPGPASWCSHPCPPVEEGVKSQWQQGGLARLEPPAGEIEPPMGDPPSPHPGPLGFRKSTSKPTKAEGPTTRNQAPPRPLLSGLRIPLAQTRAPPPPMLSDATPMGHRRQSLVGIPGGLALADLPLSATARALTLVTTGTLTLVVNGALIPG
ncbi:LOW QUALITY PROTEIN: uncharacterized protein C8orf90 homolog [Phacochoerus africanus]|uniref:LOW QUALITY PROTEIN: uncharacterized protein C8orf90 homolog n=1 Tax=Phacochoerus africanus TaxID=41426 RepID=UPI001FD9C6EB|nr:LOW QUALITY PROTEIN: uncharacterized protein C8orf90 homolog [Phacochoerus africanus]